MWERIAAVIMAALVLSFMMYIIWRNQPFGDPNLVIVTRVLLSLATATFGATVPGFINVSWTGAGLVVRSGGALGLFVLTYFGTPQVLPMQEPKSATPRQLSVEQRTAIAAALKTAPAVTLFIPVIASKESQAYSGQFQDIFRKAGWKFLHFMGGPSRPKPYPKIRIGWRQPKSPSYLAVATGLKNAHIAFKEAEFALSDEEGRDIILLDVGVIPMTDYQIAVDRTE